MTCQLPRRSFLCFLAVLLIAAGTELSAVFAQESPEPAGVRAFVHTGGIGRYLEGRWGVVKATITNEAEGPEQTNVIVTPPGSTGVQYSRRITVPGKSSIESTWPVFVPDAGKTDGMFQYISAPDEEKGVVRRLQHEEMVATFGGIIQPASPGFTGWLSNPDAEHLQTTAISDFLRAMRFESAARDTTLISVIVEELNGNAECLDPLNQLAVSSRELGNYPNVCDSIRLWMQRGGRLLIMLDQTGPEAAELLLGDALPVTVVGEASTNKVVLNLNPEYRTDSFRVREVTREFDEPIHYLRVVADAGEAIWTVDGWPVAIRIPYGEGFAVVTTIAPEVFFQGRMRNSDAEAAHEPIASMRRFHETLFIQPESRLLKQEHVIQQAAAQIGYQIPSRTFATLLTVGFPVLLLVTGLFLWKRQKGEWLIWVLPLISIAVSIPAVTQAMSIRSVAPETVIQTQMVQAVPGQTRLVADGFATTYMPDADLLKISAREGAIVNLAVDPANMAYRRLVWQGNDHNEWLNVRQSAGISSFAIRNSREFSSPLRAVGTFDEQGLKGRLVAADLSNLRDAILAGRTPDRMSVQLTGDGEFRCDATAVLTPDQFFTSSLLDDQQRQHALVYADLFKTNRGLEAFPEQPSILYWADATGSPIEVGSEGSRRLESLLVVQPLEIEAPDEGASITIPPALLPFRTLADDTGSFSSIYDSSRRFWDLSGRETAGKIRAQFEIPSVCLPFEPTKATLQLKIRAGSRKVRVLCGNPEQLTLVQELSSPVNVFDFVLPTEQIKASARDGKVIVQVEVSELIATAQPGEAIGEQDDSWVVERLLLTLSGSKTAVSSAQP